MFYYTKSCAMLMDLFIHYDSPFLFRGLDADLVDVSQHYVEVHPTIVFLASSSGLSSLSAFLPSIVVA